VQYAGSPQQGASGANCSTSDPEKVILSTRRIGICVVGVTRIFSATDREAARPQSSVNNRSVRQNPLINKEGFLRKIRQTFFRALSASAHPQGIGGGGRKCRFGFLLSFLSCCALLPYKPSFAAGLSRKRDLSRMYLRTVSRDWWRDWRMMESSGTPLR
jgi:hypothetical protein